MRISLSLMLSVGVAILIVLASIIAMLPNIKIENESSTGETVMGKVVLLPYPVIKDVGLSVEEALAIRRSIREFTDDPLTINQLSQILWAAYGINYPARGFRTCPSAGATYPLVLYVVIGKESVIMNNGSFLNPGSYRYDPHTHSLTLIKEGDLRTDLRKAALNQEWVEDAPVDVIIAAVYERTTDYYGERGIRYVHMEVGHAGQNIYLEAASLGLGTVAVGAFHDEQVAKVVGLRSDEAPLYIMPVGTPSKQYSVTEEDIAQYIDSAREGAGLK